MASEQAAAGLPFELGPSTLRPVDVTSEGLPVAMRGYDRERVDRLLERVAEAYALTLRKTQSQRKRLESLQAELAAAEGEAAASARSVAELMQSSAVATGQSPPTPGELHELEVRLEHAERERDQALVDLREVSERATELGRQLETLESEQRLHAQAHAEEAAQPPVAASNPDADAETALLLIAATRAADDVRTTSRARALRTLTKARDLSALVHAETERERAALAEMHERRLQAEHAAEEILAEAGRVEAALEERRVQAEHDAEQIVAQARARADHLVAVTEEERRRVRELLADALASLDAEAAEPAASLVDDLSSRLYETTEPTIT